MSKLIKLLIYLLITLIPLGVFSRIEIESGLAFYFNDILLGIIIITWLLYSLIVKQKIILAKEYIPIFLFLLIGVISLVGALRFLGLKEVILSSLYLFRFFEYMMLSLIIFNIFKVSETKYLMRLLIFSACILALLGFVQYVIIPDFSTTALEGGWDPHQYRLLSTFFDPNFLGLFFSLTLIILLVNFLFSNHLVYLILLLVNFFALVLTYSRSAYLSFVLPFLTLGLIRWRKLLIVLPLVFGFVILFFPRAWIRFEEGVGAGTSGEARLSAWKNALEVFKDNPLIGVGFNTYRYVQAQYGFLSDGTLPHSASGTDSSLLLVLTTTGVIGLAAFLTFFAMLVGSAIFLIKKQIREGYILLAALSAVLVHSQFVNSLFFPWIIEWFAIIIGLSLVKKYEKI